MDAIPKQMIYEITKSEIKGLSPTTFGEQGFGEREDLQRLLREKIEIVAPDTLVIAEEFSEWQESNRRVDLLAVDREANLVVIELKRTDDGGHMELQAVRYAAMVSAMDFDEAVTAYTKYLSRLGSSASARDELLKFLEWDEPDGSKFAHQVRITLVAAEFNKEITTSVIWLNEQGLDIRCVRLKPFLLDNRLLIDVQQIIPLPEAAEYTVQLRRKAEESRFTIRPISPDLKLAIDAYDASAPDNLRTRGKANYYRYIVVAEWKTATAHYEFYRGKDYVGVELHLESDAVRPLADFLQTFAGKTVAGNQAEIEWEPLWMAGRGRLRAKFSAGSDPHAIAEGMRDLIQLTRIPVCERLQAIRAAG